MPFTPDPFSPLYRWRGFGLLTARGVAPRGDPASFDLGRPGERFTLSKGFPARDIILIMSSSSTKSLTAELVLQLPPELAREVSRLSRRLGVSRRRVIELSVEQYAENLQDYADAMRVLKRIEKGERTFTLEAVEARLGLAGSVRQKRRKAA